MDLSFARFELDGNAFALPGDLAVLMVGITARQSLSATAIIDAREARHIGEDQLHRPARGPFNRAMAATIRRWQEE